MDTEENRQLQASTTNSLTSTSNDVANVEIEVKVEQEDEVEEVVNEADAAAAAEEKARRANLAGAVDDLLDRLARYRDMAAQQMEQTSKAVNKRKAAAKKQKEEKEQKTMKRKSGAAAAPVPTRRSSRRSLRHVQPSTDGDGDVKETQASKPTKVKLRKLLNEDGLDLDKDEKDDGEAEETVAKQTKKERPESVNDHDVMSVEPAFMTGGKLRGYQLEGANWLNRLHLLGLNGILADEMGLGKTIQSIAMICHMYEHATDAVARCPTLIVAPLSTLKNWQREFNRFAPEMPVVLYHGSQEERERKRHGLMRGHTLYGVKVAPIIVTSFEMVVADVKFLARYEYSYFVLDEGHRIKNHESKLHMYLNKLRIPSRVLLTGTPLQNNLTELWALLSFLLGDLIGSKDIFLGFFNFAEVLQKDAGKPLQSFRKKKLKSRAVLAGEQEGSILQQEQEDGMVTKLHSILATFMLRRCKKDVELNLPPKREILVYAPMAPEQLKWYTSFVNGVLEEMNYKSTALDSNTIDASRIIDGDRVRVSKFSMKQMMGFLSASDTELYGKYSNNEMVEITHHHTLNQEDDMADLLRDDTPSPQMEDAQSLVHKMNTPNGSTSAQHMDVVKDDTPPSLNSNSNSPPPSVSERHSPVAKSAAEVASALDTPVKSASPPLMDTMDSPDKLTDPSYEPPKFVSKNSGSSCSSDGGASVSNGVAASRKSVRVSLQSANKSMCGTAGPPEYCYNKNAMTNVLVTLRKLTMHPHLLRTPLDQDSLRAVDERLVRDSGKMRLLDQMLPALHERKHKVLIFTQYTQMLDILLTYCELREWKYNCLDGRMSLDEREVMIDEFNEQPDSFLFVVSTRAGGLGINLTAADTVIMYDSDWNPQADLQAQDRCHRIGQTRPVVVYRFAARNTIDQVMIERAQNKRRIEKLVIHGHDHAKSRNETDKMRMTRDEMMTLLQSQDWQHVVDSTNDQTRKGEEGVSVADAGVLSAECLEALLDRTDMLQGGYAPTVTKSLSQHDAFQVLPETIEEN